MTYARDFVRSGGCRPNVRGGIRRRLRLRRIEYVEAQPESAVSADVPPEPAASAGARPGPAVSDGQEHSLDPRVIPLQRILGGINTVWIGGVSFFSLLITWLAADDMPGWLGMLFPFAWLALVIGLAWMAWCWPPISYRHTRYRVDDRGIEIRRGVYFRTVVNVPRSRVQHTDVSQGPVARRFGLGTLAIYTAGTDHAMVELSGLEHGVAMRIREHLLPSESGDAV